MQAEVQPPIRPAWPDRHAAKAQAFCRRSCRRERATARRCFAGRSSACLPSNTAISAARRSIAGRSPRSIGSGCMSCAITPIRCVRRKRARQVSSGCSRHRTGGDHGRCLTASFLGHLPPQQRSTLLLVYGEGFDHEDAGRVLDSSPDTIAARLIRASASLADRLGSGSATPASATIEMLYPKGPQDHHDRAQ